MSLLPTEEREAIFDHCRYYQGGPQGSAFIDLLPYLPSVLEKVPGNLECYLEQLHDEGSHRPDKI